MSEQGCTLLRYDREHSRRSATANPPGVIRGLDSQTLPQIPKTGHPGTVGLHWLRGSVPMADTEKLKTYLDTWFGDESQDQLYGLWFYDRSTRWPNGVQLNYHSHSDRASITRGRVAIEIPGSALEVMDTAYVVSFMRRLEDFGFQCSRLDVFYDDVTRLVSPWRLARMVHDEDSDGNVLRADFTGFRRITKRTISNAKGRTFDEVAFGSRGQNGSGKYLRIYDKRLESQGENPAVRYELELSDERSQKAFEMLTHVHIKDAAGILGALVGGCIDFKKRTGDKNLARLERYEFWQTIIDRFGRVTLAGKRVQKTVDRSAAYVQKQVAGTLQMVRKAWGAEKFFPWLVDIVDGENRLRTAHFAALVEYERAMRDETTLHIGSIREYCDNMNLQLESEADGTGQAHM